MNLLFLDPSKLPDRIDSTLTIPRLLHPPMPWRHDESSAAVGKNKVSTSLDVDVSDAHGGTKKSLVGKKKTDKKKKKSKLLFQKKIHLNVKQSIASSGTSDGNFLQGVTVGGDNLLLASNDVERDNDAFAPLEQKQQQPPQHNEETKGIPMGTDQAKTADNATEDNLLRREEGFAINTTLRTQQNEPSQPTNKTSPPPKKKKKTSPSNKKIIAAHEDLESAAWTSCYAVSFNEQGTYLASGHASGLIPVHSFLSRCLSAVYSPPKPSVDEVVGDGKHEMEDGGVNDINSDVPLDALPCPRKQERTRKQSKELQLIHGVTSLSWDKTGRYLLAGAVGDSNLRVMDNSHPYVGWNCAEAVRMVASWETKNDGGNFRNYAVGNGAIGEERMQKENKESIRTVLFRGKALKAEIPLRLMPVSLGCARLLKSRECCLNQDHPFFHEQNHCSDTETEQSSFSRQTVSCIRHSTVQFQLPQPLGGPCQFHPMDYCIGLACMMDSSLALFYIPPVAFYEILPLEFSSDEDKLVLGDCDDEEKDVMHKLLKDQSANMAGNFMYLIPPRTKETSPSQLQYSVTHAAFGGNGNFVYAVTNCGTLLGFDVTPSILQFLKGQASTLEGKCGDVVRPSLCVKIPGGASALQLVVSKNGKYVLVNSDDCALRLYEVNELKTVGSCTADSSCNALGESQVKPKFVFQDPVSKAPWASCDFSADGEYVVSGCNSYPQPGDNYQLFLWNVVTGELLDQLTGPSVSLHCLSCHPTRPFIAVGSSDGIVDIWGPRINWIAFAPDFQALQQNVLYEEQEDEFDVVIDCESHEGAIGNTANILDCCEEEEVDIVTPHNYEDPFYFDTRVLKMMHDKPTKKVEQY